MEEQMTYRMAGNLHDEAEREHAASVALQNEADIAYVAMIQGVDLSVEDEEESHV